MVLNMSFLKVKETKLIEEEVEEEDVGLACPALDELSYMLDEEVFFDLAENKFFDRIDDEGNITEEISRRPHNEFKQKVGKGKDFKVVMSALINDNQSDKAAAISESVTIMVVKKPTVDKLVRMGSNTSAKSDNSSTVSLVKKAVSDKVVCISSNTSAKPDQGALSKKPTERLVNIPKDAASLEAKLESTKRKLHEQYAQVERERKRRRQIQFTNDLPPPPLEAEAKPKFIRRINVTIR